MPSLRINVQLDRDVAGGEDAGPFQRIGQTWRAQGGSPHKGRGRAYLAQRDR